jgi:hypothetical protein
MRCKATLIVYGCHGMKDYQSGERCPDECFGESQFCWTHYLSNKNGVRTQREIEHGLSPVLEEF